METRDDGTRDSLYVAGDWSAQRLHADMQRAVGGPLNLIRELSRVSERIDASIAADWIIRRMQFFTYELIALIGTVPSSITVVERLGKLNQFFFETLKFRCLDTCTAEVETLLLGKVLGSRTATANVLTLIYAFLAERIDLKLEFIDLKPSCFLKLTETGPSHYIDIAQNGAAISTSKLIETIQTRFKRPNFNHSSLLETYPFASFVADYILELRAHLAADTDPELLLFLQNIAITYEPSNLGHVGERALLHRRLGNFRSAMADLKRYFAFYDKEQAPMSLQKLHGELSGLLARNPSGTELND